MARTARASVTDGRRVTRDPSPSSPAGDRELGSVVAGKFRLDAVLGRGGMGVVYRAWHLRLEEPVALKLLNPETAERSDGVERFLREARAGARLKSEHVVRISDAGTLDDGAPYVAMELLEGQDLAKVLEERGPLPMQEAVDHVRSVALALGEAHAAGIIHRDIKPSNLFLSRSGIKVLDFGIAKVAGQTATATASVDTLTASATVLGSPAYMAPEQIRAASDVDQRADIWSLGVVLFELLTGRLPFAGTSAPALLAAISADEPRRLRELCPSIPRELERIVVRCLAREASRRPDAASLRRMLASFSSAPPLAKPRRTLRAFVALILVCLAIGIWRVSVAAPSPARVRSILPQVSSLIRERKVATAPADKLQAAPGNAPKLTTPLPRRPPARKRESFEASVEAATADRK